jgi:ATP-independent RNA helicase DbpA
LQDIETLLPATTLQRCEIPDAKRSADPLLPVMTTIQINGGRKNKLRPGDLLGALTAEGGVPGEVVGSIDLFDTYSYIAVRNAQVKEALSQLANRPIKGRRYRARVKK